MLVSPQRTRAGEFPESVVSVHLEGQRTLVLHQMNAMIILLSFPNFRKDGGVSTQTWRFVLVNEF